MIDKNLEQLRSISDRLAAIEARVVAKAARERDESLWTPYYRAALSGCVREYTPHEVLDTDPEVNGLRCIARDAALLADAALEEHRRRWATELPEQGSEWAEECGCGASARGEFVHQDPGFQMHRYSIQCMPDAGGCGASTDLHDNRAAAIQQWNTIARMEPGHG